MTASELAARLQAQPAGVGKWLAHCPAHDDRDPSLSVWEDADGRRGLKCHAGCTTDAVLATIGLTRADVWPPAPGGNGRTPARRIAAVYPYHDATGNLIMQVVRYTPKDFRQRRPDGKGGWDWHAPTDPPLYRLPDVLAALAAGTNICVTEGERDADSLAAIGLTATTSPMGAGKWRDHHGAALTGANVIIFPDNDKPGHRHAAQVAASCRTYGACVRVLMLPGLAEHGDVSDWLAAGGSREELLRLVAEAPDWLPGSPEDSDATEPDSEERPERRSVADVLIDLGREAALFHDERSDAYGVLPATAGTRLLRVRGRDFRRWLAGQYHSRTGKAANGEALASALGVLEARAVFQSERRQLHNRFARTADGIWLDLADGRAVQITPAGWQVIERPPVLFRRYAHQEVIPPPVPGGKLADLLPLLQPLRQEDALLLTSWLAVVPVADIPRPLLLLHGAKGSAKTTRARMLRRLVDPSAVDEVDAGRDPAELAQVLDHHAVPVFDNVTKLQTWQADLLCRAVTGGGFTKRELYSDAEDVLMSFRRAAIITGINVPSAAPDLLDRCILIEAQPIPAESRREEAALWREYDRLRPAVLGGLLDTLSGAMRVYDGLRLPALPRMADWSRWAAAAAVAQGFRAEDLIAAITGNVARQVEEAIESDPVAAAVRDLAAVGEWHGTASDLLTLLTERIGERAARATDWPRRADGLTRRLRMLASTLAEVGVVVAWRRGGKGVRTITLRGMEVRNPASPASPASPTAREAAPHLDPMLPPEVTPTVTGDAIGVTPGDCRHPENSSGSKRGDAGDAGDDKKRTLTPQAQEVRL